MRFSAACVVTALALPSSGLLAQEVVQIEPGQRVRVTAPELGVDRQTAELESLDSRTLTVVTDSRLRYPRTAVTQLVERGAGSRERISRILAQNTVGQRSESESAR